MKRVKVQSILIFLLSVIMSMPAFAGRWEQLQSGEWTYYNDNGAPAVNQWVRDGDAYYYIGPDSLMLVNNYTPDGYWVNGSGIYESRWGRRTDSASPRRDLNYYGTYTYSFFQDFYADGNTHWSLTETFPSSSNYKVVYELYPLGPFSFEIDDLLGGTTMGYVSISPDGSVAYISMGGITQRCVAASY